MIRCATSAELVAGLRDDGHAGEQRAGGLLGQAPGREVEGVDVHGDAVARHGHVLAEEARAAAERHALAVGEQLRVAERLAELGVGGERDRRAVDVELGVAAGVAAVRDRQLDQLVAVRLERVAHRLQQLRRARRTSARAGRGRRRRARTRARRARSMPSAPDPASGSSVAGFRSVSGAPVPSTQRAADVAPRRSRHRVTPSWASTNA